MKALLLFLLGVVAGAFAYHLYRERDGRWVPATAIPAPTPAPTPTPTPTPTPEPESTAQKIGKTAREVGARTRDAAVGARDAISDKLTEWKLTPDDLREDLKRGGEIIRTKARHAGHELGDARILAIIKAKYVIDRDISAMEINIDVQDGQVTLEGKVGSPTLVGRAIAQALDTDGVVSVVSRLSVE